MGNKLDWCGRLPEQPLASHTQTTQREETQVNFFISMGNVAATCCLVLQFYRLTELQNSHLIDRLVLSLINIAFKGNQGSGFLQVIIYAAA